LRNTGSYPIRITKLLGTNNQSISTFESSTYNISDYYYMAPGEEKYFGATQWYSLPASRNIIFSLGPTGSSQHLLYAASQVCTNSSQPGTLIMKEFGFEYIAYIEGQQITKRQVGAKPLVIKCTS